MTASSLSLPDLGVTLATYEGGNPAGAPLFLLHGNSLAADIFTKQWHDPTLQPFRLVTMDLPGHGQSPPAPGHYALPAMRAVVRAAVQALRLEQALVVAHSYAGLLFLELLPELPRLQGLMVVGAPPVSSPEHIQAAFQFNETVMLYYTLAVNAAQAEVMAQYALAPEVASDTLALLTADILRTDGQARTDLGASLAAGDISDQVGYVARTTVPLAFVAGALDRGLHLAYFERLAAPSRWGGPVHLIPAAGHSPFIESPVVFNQLLLDFAMATTYTLPHRSSRTALT